MFKINIDINDRLFNGQRGFIRDNEFPHGSACKVYVKFP